MTSMTFDSLAYFEKLKEAGTPEAQAKAQAEAMRQQTEAIRQQLEEQAKTQAEAIRQQAEAQARLIQSAVEKYDEASRKEIATKGDVQDVRLEIEKVRAELKVDIERVRYDLLKWQLGIALTGFGTLGVIMAKGFGWLGF